MKDLLKSIFYPFGKINKKTAAVLLVSQLLILFLYLETRETSVLPQPTEVLASLWKLFNSGEFYDDLIASIVFIAKGLGYSILLTMPISYAWTIPFFKPFVELVIKCRYLTFSCVLFLFTMLTSSLESLKMSLLIFGIVPFFATSYVGVIAAVPEYQINKARINKKNQWETLLETIIIGKMDALFEVMRQNFAIAWAMITSVEGYTMAGGGLGTYIIKRNRAINIADIFAIAIVIILLGIVFDFLLKYLRKSLFEYIKNAKK